MLPPPPAPLGYAFTNFAGLPGQPGSTDGTGSDARFNQPLGVAVDMTGNVYVADQFNCTIRRITPAGEVTTLAGAAGRLGSADGTGSAARFGAPVGVAVDSWERVRGRPDQLRDSSDHCRGGGDDADGTDLAPGSGARTGSPAGFLWPYGVAVDGSGNVYVADTGSQTILQILPGDMVTTLAGLAWTVGSTDGMGSGARFDQPSGVAVGSAGVLYVADWWNHTIRQVTAAGVVTTLAGLPGQGGSVDGTGSGARFDYPAGVAADSAGNVFVADSLNDTIRQVTPAGVVTTLAGLAGNPGSADGIGSAARFFGPCGVALDGAGNIYVADTANHRISKGVPIVAPGPPQILTQPQSQLVAAGGSAIFSVGAIGEAPLDYQWFLENTAIPGAKWTSCQVSNSGNYTVVVTNSAGAATSGVAVLTVAVVPVIITQPLSQDLGAGSTAVLSVAAIGEAPLHYQWLFENFIIPGANGTTCQVSNGGMYTVVVTNSAGATTSQRAFVQMYMLGAWILSQPQSQTVQAGTSVSFSAAASGVPGPSLRWQLSADGGATWTNLVDGSGLRGSATEALVISNTPVAMAGCEFRLTATNALCGAVSQAATLTVLASGPTIIYDDTRIPIMVNGNPVDFYPGPLEVGNEILFTGPIYMTSLSCELCSTNPSFVGNVEVQLSLYSNNGSPVNNRLSPGTLLYQTGWALYRPFAVPPHCFIPPRGATFRPPGCS